MAGDRGDVCEIVSHARKAIIPGIKNPVDVNAFFGTKDDFQKFVATGDNIAKSTAE